MGVGGTRLVVESIPLEATFREDIHLAVEFILLVDLLRERECPSIHLVVDPREGLLGQAQNTLPVRVSSLLEVALRELALLSTLQGLVHQALQDRGQMDQALTDQGQTGLAPMVQDQMDRDQTGLVQTGLVQMDQALMGQVPTVQGQTAQARMDQVQMVQAPMAPGQMGQGPMVQVPMAQGQMARVRTVQAQTAQARTDQVPMDQAQTDLGVEATAKSPRSSPPRNSSAQLRLHLQHAPLHLKSSWQNVMQQTLSLEDRIAHFALLALFALSPTQALRKYKI